MTSSQLAYKLSWQSTTLVLQKSWPEFLSGFIFTTGQRVFINAKITFISNFAICKAFYHNVTRMCYTTLTDVFTWAVLQDPIQRRYKVQDEQSHITQVNGLFWWIYYNVIIKTNVWNEVQYIYYHHHKFFMKLSN